MEFPKGEIGEMDQKEIKKLLAKGSSVTKNAVTALEVLGNAFCKTAKPVRDFNKIAIILNKKEDFNGRENERIVGVVKE